MSRYEEAHIEYPSGLPKDCGDPHCEHCGDPPIRHPKCEHHLFCFHGRIGGRDLYRCADCGIQVSRLLD